MMILWLLNVALYSIYFYISGTAVLEISKLVKYEFVFGGYFLFLFIQQLFFLLPRQQLFTFPARQQLDHGCVSFHNTKGAIFNFSKGNDYFTLLSRQWLFRYFPPNNFFHLFSDNICLSKEWNVFYLSADNGCFLISSQTSPVLYFYPEKSCFLFSLDNKVSLIITGLWINILWTVGGQRMLYK